MLSRLKETRVSAVEKGKLNFFLFLFFFFEWGVGGGAFFRELLLYKLF